MPKILDESALQAARSNLKWCYLCGRRLRKGQATQAEHVIPKSVLSLDGPINGHPVILNVHTKCDPERKRSSDSLLAMFTKIHTEPEELWPESGHLRTMSLTTEIIQDEMSGELMASFGNVGPLLEGVRIWVRGLYATTYGKLLHNKSHIGVFPPMRSKSKGTSFADADKHSNMILKSIIAGQLSNVYDGIMACSGTLTFTVVWLHICQPVSPWIGCWMIEFPGLPRWIVESPPPGPRPWHGMIGANYPPNCASIIGNKEFHLFNTEYNRHTV